MAITLYKLIIDYKIILFSYIQGQGVTEGLDKIKSIL